jgi:hypothetical protein
MDQHTRPQARSTLHAVGHAVPFGHHLSQRSRDSNCAFVASNVLGRRSLGLDLASLRWAASKQRAAGRLAARPVAGRLEKQVADLVFPSKTNAANERLAQHLWAHRDDLFTFLRQPGLDATNWRAELAIRFGVILRKVWGGSRTWAGARAQSILMSVWRTCWQQGRSALDSLSQLLRGRPVALAMPP